MPREKSSLVWSFFEKEDDGIHAVCSLCNGRRSHSGGTTNLANHLKGIHPDEWAAEQARHGFQEAARARPVARSVEEDYKQIASYLAKDMRPFRVVEDPGFRELLQYAAPQFRIPSRKHLSKVMIPQLYNAVVDKLKPLINAANYVALTMDLWTSRSQTPYISVTAHFLTEGKLRAAVLASNPLPGSHTAVRIAEAVSEILDSYNCSHKIAACTTDNGANVVAAIAQLRIRHIACIAHTINLVVTDAIEGCPEVSGVIERCKQIVTHFKSSNVAANALEEALNALGHNEVRLVQCVPTRWNSSFDMVERILRICDALAMAQLRLPQAPPPLSGLDVEIATDIVAALKPFKSATEMLSGESYTTAALIIPITQGMFKALTDAEASAKTGVGQGFIEALRRGSTLRLAQYEQTAKATRGATLLDPRFKRFGFRLDDHYQQARRQIEAELRLRMEMVDGPQAGAPLPAGDVAGPAPRQAPGGLLQCVFERVQASDALGTPAASATIQMRQYVERPVIALTDDPVGYWTVRPIDGNHLAHVAERYLVGSATSVPSERVFSAAGMVLSDRRSRLSPKKAAQLIFLRQNRWLY